MSQPPVKGPTPGLLRTLSVILVLLGAGCAYWAFQPKGPDSFGRFQAFGDMLMRWKVGPVSPLALLLAAFLAYEAAKMWRRAAR